MPRRNMGRCLLATCLAFSALACGVAAADTEPPHGEPPAAEKAPAAQPPPPAEHGPSEPDVAACVDGYLAARQWVDTLAPPDPEAPESHLTLPGVRGVSVILRHQGRMVGIGDDWPPLAGDERMLRRAVGRAIGRALGDRVISALPPAERDAAGKQLTVELEFAGRPEPLLGRTIAECATRVEPGLDGLAIRRAGGGKPVWAVAFPSRLQATNLSGGPERTIVSLLLDVGLPAKDLPELARIEPVGIFKFSSLRLAQTGPDRPPIVRGRGAARVADGDVTSAAIVAHARRVLDRLRESMPQSRNADAPSAGIGLVGDYHPVSDECKPLVAPPHDQALVAWAAAAVAASDKFPAADRAMAKQFAVAILEDLVILNPNEESPTTATPSLAFALCAVTTLGGPNDLSEDAADLARIAREKLAVGLQSGSPNDRSLACLAAAMTLGTEQRLAPASDVRRALDIVWDGTPKEQLVAFFPWLILAESAYARATGQAAARGGEARALTQALFLAQAGFGDLTSQQDLRGGFRLTNGRRGGVTAQSLRPGLGLAAMVAYPGFLTEDALPLHRERLLALVRFAFELTADEELASFYRNPARVLGGMREALWDSDQPVAANAVGVLVDVLALEAGVGANGHGHAPDEPGPANAPAPASPAAPPA